MTELLIHEFSTGITPDGNQQQWVSKGFTGRYMNMTMTVVPPGVERAIANHGFAVVEGTSSKNPAIIGRVVVGASEQDSWSVVAFVTRGEDEYGRSFGFHRYFLCQGTDCLWMLIEWLEAYLQQNGQYPVFNPFKIRQPGQPHRWPKPAYRTGSPRELPQVGYAKTPAVLSSTQALSMGEMNQLAEQKANGQLGQVAWALDVEALEQPERFLVIKPASARAEQILQQPVAAPVRSSAAYAAIDEAAIKGAIKGLTNSSQVNEALFETLVTSIGVVKHELKTADQISKYWNEIFDKQGAANALSQNIMSPQMIRLLALRAIVMPDKLHQYLMWLKIEKASQQTTSSSESLKFQQQLKRVAQKWQSSNPQQLDSLRFNLLEGIKILLYKFFKESTSFEAMKNLSIEAEVWALESREGLWGLCWSTLQTMMMEDLKRTEQEFAKPSQQPIRTQQPLGSNIQTGTLANAQAASPGIGSYQLIGQGLEHVWDQILRYRRYPHQRNVRFFPFAELFSASGNADLAAVFYQISCEAVPAEIYKLVADPSPWQRSKLFGIGLYRAQTKLEKFAGIAVKLLPIVVVSLSVAAIFLLLRNCDPNSSTSTNLPQNRTPGQTDTKLEFDKKIDYFIDFIEEMKREKEKQSKRSLFELAEESFSRTKASIKGIASDPSHKNGATQDKEYYIDKIGDILSKAILPESGHEKLDHKLDHKTLEGSKEDHEKWIAAIYAYQKNEGIGKDGIISEKDSETAKRLIKGIKDINGTRNDNNDKGSGSSFPSPSTPSPSPSPSPP